jgi:glycosyltransferase involved in cell wall biosynthesis
MINEQDISILIPSYKRPKMTLKAVKSALATNAGEIIVSEDDPGTDIFKHLEGIRDSRLKMYLQPQNLGLWKNHLFLLKVASKPWIKFLQTDDFITPDCLTRMCEAVTEQTSVVSALSISYDLDTSVTRKEEITDKVHTWKYPGYLDRIKIVGNELGRPSNCLFRADLIDKSEEAWRNDQSGDLIMNVIAAANGDVVILPEGFVFIGSHEGQDMFVQSFQLIVTRLKNSLIYLRNKNINKINDFVRVYGFVELIGIFRIMLSNIKRGKRFVYKGFLRDVFFILRLLNIVTLFKDRKFIKKYYRCKFNRIKDIITILPKTSF